MASQGPGSFQLLAVLSSPPWPVLQWSQEVSAVPGFSPHATMPRGRKRETYVFSYCFFIRPGRPFPEASCIFSAMLFWPKWHPRLIARPVAGRENVLVMTGHHDVPTREVCSLGTCWKNGVFCFILMIVDTAGLYRMGAGIGGVLQCAR